MLSRIRATHASTVWAAAAVILAAGALALAIAARHAMAQEALLDGAWCAPSLHVRDSSVTLLGHCSQCWPAIAAPVLASAALVRAVWLQVREAQS